MASKVLILTANRGEDFTKSAQGNRQEPARAFLGYRFRNALLGSPAELFFWRTRAQSEVDLVVKQAGGLQAFEIKWSPCRVSGRAFRDARGVEVEPIRPDNSSAMDIFKASPASD